MAGAAPVFFNLALMTLVIYGSRSGIGFRNLLRLYLASGPAAWLFVLVPAVAGFWAGIDGSARLLGHAFWTHHANERSVMATAVVWVVFLLSFWWGLRLLPVP